MSRVEATTAVLVTRPSNEATQLVRALRATALRVHAVPTIELVPVPTRSTAGRRVRRDFWALRPADWIVVTSRFGARVAARHLLLADGLSYAPVRWATIGSAAANALTTAGIQPDVTASITDPHGLVSAMSADGLSGRRVLLARSDVAHPWLAGMIAAAGALVHDVTTYRTIEGPSQGGRRFAKPRWIPTCGPSWSPRDRRHEDSSGWCKANRDHRRPSLRRVSNGFVRCQRSRSDRSRPPRRVRSACA